MTRLDTARFPSGVELRFGRQACRTVQSAGLSFRKVDSAALQVAGAARVGSRFEARMSEWVIVGRRAGRDRIDVRWIVRPDRIERRA